MNPSILPVLSALLGQQATPPPGQPLPPVKGDAPPVEEAEITVSQPPFPKSKYRDGIVQGGTFRLGGLGGNILGALGDAFLTQSGNNPRYSPRLREARSAEAMQDFTTDPMRALQMYNQIDPANAAKLWQEQQGIDQAKVLNEQRVRAAQDDFENNTHSRAQALIGASTPQTYSALRKKYYDYYTARGVEPVVDLPETYDEAALHALRLAGVPAPKQAELESQEEYRKAVLGQRSAAQIALDRRAEMIEKGRMNRFIQSEEGRDRRLETSEEGRDRRSTAKKTRPVLTFGRNPDGTRYVKQ